MVNSLDEVIERLQYKADNIKAKLEPSYFTECIDYLKSLPREESKWIPCSERLPEPDECVLVTVKIRDIYSAINKKDIYEIDIASYYELDNDWIFNNEYYSYIIKDYEVIAWMPLPSPYEQAEQMKGE
jgi:hypothetical protein